MSPNRKYSCLSSIRTLKNAYWRLLALITHSELSEKNGLEARSTSEDHSKRRHLFITITRPIPEVRFGPGLFPRRKVLRSGVLIRLISIRR
jgi:hypothetical protein